MHYTIEEQSPGRLVVAVKTPYAGFEPFLARAARELAAEVEIEGFRKGKAPETLVRSRIGENRIRQEASRMHLDSLFGELLTSLAEKEFAGTSFEVIGEPAATQTSAIVGGSVEYRIILSILPPATLPDYRAIAKNVFAERRTPVVDDADVRKAIEWLRESRTKLITVARPAAAGDRVEIDFSAKRNGVPIDGAGSKNHPLVIGGGRFPAGFEDALIGMSAGEEKTFTVNLPPSAGGDAGPAECTARMRLVQQRDIPEWNDEFARSLGSFESAAEAEASVRDGLRLEKETEERERLRVSALEAIAADTTVHIPDALIEQESHKMLAELEASVARMGVSFDDYLGHIKKTAASLQAEWRKDAEKRVTFALVLREIARRERIEPSDEEVMAAVNRTVAHRGMTEQDLASLDRDAFLSYNRGVARNEKVFSFLERAASGE